MLGAMKWIFSQFLSATVLPEVERVSAASTTPSCKAQKACRQGAGKQLGQPRHAAPGHTNLNSCLPVRWKHVCSCSKLLTSSKCAAACHVHAAAAACRPALSPAHLVDHACNGGARLPGPWWWHALGLQQCVALDQLKVEATSIGAHPVLLLLQLLLILSHC